MIRDRVLCRFPRLYARLLRFRRAPNWDKIVFLEEIPAGAVVFDVGANFGPYTVLFSNMAGPSGAVHAFEPSPPTFAALEQNVAKTRPRGPVRLNHCALGCSAGQSAFFAPAGDPGQASLKKHSAGSWKDGAVQEMQVRIATLDHYAAEAKLSKLDFLKIDVEGAELLMLQGGMETLRRFRPKVHIEIAQEWLRDFGTGPEEILDLLKRAGYSRFSQVGPRGLSMLDERSLPSESINVLASI